MARVVLIGDPVSHSLSPAMQNAAFAALGLPHRYELMRVTADALPEAIASLRADDLLGANVTIPHKERIDKHLDRVLDTAHQIGAVNTIFKLNGRLAGDNTDAGGFTDALAERGVDVAGKRVLLMGAGGAARACFHQLRRANAAITVTGRSQAKVVSMVGSFTDVVVIEAWPPLRIDSRDVVVNATSLGMHGESVLDGVELPRSTAIVDVVATAEETPLVTRARASGCVVVDGLLMLLHQGTRSFRLWTGLEAPVEVMRAALPRRV